MKKCALNLSIVCAALILLTSCEHQFTSQTVVHEDGSLDKTIVLEQKGTTSSFMKLDHLAGWEKTVAPVSPENDTSKSDRKYTLTYKKTFPSTDAANIELAPDSDSAFRIVSSFDKKFRWFYTYIRYSDTYQKVNPLTLPVDDYLAPEDYQFINRLPAEGTSISTADSIRLIKLNEVLFDIYGKRALFEEHFSIAKQLLQLQRLEPQWLDSLGRHKENLFSVAMDEKNQDENFIVQALDSLKFPIDQRRSATLYDSLSNRLDQRLEVVSTALDGKYLNTITMPYEIIATNADSLNGNTAAWRPPVTKFLVTDYTMYAECRKPNLLSFVVTALILGLTLYLFLRKKG